MLPVNLINEQSEHFKDDAIFYLHKLTAILQVNLSNLGGYVLMQCSAII